MRAQLARTGHRAQVEADIEREGLVSFFELLPHRIAFQRDVHLVGKRRFRHDALHDLHLAVFLVRIEHVDGIFADRLAVARKTVREARSKPLQARPFVFLGALVVRLLGQVEAALLLQREEQVDDVAIARHRIERHLHAVDFNGIAHLGVQAGNPGLQAVVNGQVVTAPEKPDIARLHLHQARCGEGDTAQQHDEHGRNRHHRTAARHAGALALAVRRLGRPPLDRLPTLRSARARRRGTILRNGAQRRVHAVELDLHLRGNRTRVQIPDHRPAQLVFVVEPLMAHRATSTSSFEPCE